MNNPVIEQLTDNDLIQAVRARGLKVSTRETTKRVRSSDEECLVSAIQSIASIKDGLISINKCQLNDEQSRLFKDLAKKARCVYEKIEKSKRPVYTGAKRGPKPKKVA